MTVRSRARLTRYLSDIESELHTARATEHSYRPALKALLEKLGTETLGISISATNDPKRIACGAPDYNISRSSAHGPLTLGYVEAKDIGVPLDDTERSDQMGRYLRALPNLILTDYLDFRWYVDGQCRSVARLATTGTAQRLTVLADGEEQVLGLLAGFLEHTPAMINGPHELATRMAHLTHMIRDLVVQTFLTKAASDTLRDLRQAFAEVLLPGLSVNEFADMFSQTLAYGLFAARATHVGAAPFRRQDAAREIPRTNPFLRRLFATVTGPDLDDEPFVGFVDDLAQLLADTDMSAVLADFGRSTRQEDPVVHFYETFLAAYDPQLREKRGVYYTPEPVVSYIVRAVDHVLKTHLGCPRGLADTAMTAYELTDAHGNVVAREVPRVLLLDPATGTATFLYTVISHIRAEFMQTNNAGLWSGFVREQLLPRLFGFELLMAPYAVAHLKLGMQLAAQDLPEELRGTWAYDFATDERLGIYLTNALEEAIQSSQQVLLSSYIATEANEAAVIKREQPIMVVLGNPPYSGHSANRGAWISGLVREYYFVDGQRLRERNTKWLQNDYVKFVRFGEWRIQQTGAGVLAFITSNSYLDGRIFRGMRQHLMDTFTDIYVLNLHGNSVKGERSPDGSPDQNVFDIQEGVSIAVFVKEAGREGPARLHYADLQGTRERKYDWLSEYSLPTTEWAALHPTAPSYRFMPLDLDLEKEFLRGWSIADIMPVHTMAMNTHRDRFVIDFSKDQLLDRIGAFRDAGTTRAEAMDHGFSAERAKRIQNILRNDPAWDQCVISCLISAL